METFIKVGLVIVLICGPALRTALAQAPSLPELLESAIQHDYGLVNQHLDIQATELDQQKLQQAHLPRVGFTGEEAFLLTSFAVQSRAIAIPQLNIDIKENHNQFKLTSNLVSASANASVLVYSGGKISYLQKALAEKKIGQTALLEKKRQQTISDLAAAYDLLALLRQVRTMLDEGAHRLAENKKTAEKAFRYGLITKYEYQKIEVAQAQLTSKVQEYEGRRTLVLRQLQLRTHLPPVRLELIADTLRPLAIVSAGSIENRAELKALSAAIAANTYRVQAEKTWFMPKVQAATSVGYQGILGGHINSSKPVQPTGERLSASMPNLNLLPMLTVGVGVKWEIFDGHDGRREVAKASLDLQKTQNEREEAVENLELSFTKAQTEYTVAAAQIEVKTRQTQTARNALNQAIKEYRAGLLRTLELTSAEDDFQTATLDYIQALYNQRRAAIALLMATGNLTIDALQP